MYTDKNEIHKFSNVPDSILKFIYSPNVQLIKISVTFSHCAKELLDKIPDEHLWNVNAGNSSCEHLSSSVLMLVKNDNNNSKMWGLLLLQNKAKRLKLDIICFNFILAYNFLRPNCNDRNMQVSILGSLVETANFHRISRLKNFWKLSLWKLENNVSYQMN